MQKMPIHRYELVRASTNTNKFWQIEEPYKTDAGWVVKVKYGRIGTEGQVNIKVCWSYKTALDYYNAKINEKLNKKYHYVSMINPHVKPLPQPLPKSVPLGKPHEALKPKLLEALKPKPNCTHENLKKVRESKWKCHACGTEIDFEKPPTTMTAVVEIAQVRRFIDLSALRGD